jgi:hypothetical protein
MRNRQQIQQVPVMQRPELHVLRVLCVQTHHLLETLLVSPALSPTLCRLPALLLQDALASQPGRVTLHGAEQLPQQLACRHMEPYTIPQVGCPPCISS